MKKSSPVSRCTACGKTSSSIGSAGFNCSMRFNQKKYKGTMRSAVCVGDWAECPSCLATGYVEKTKCDHCNGDGYLYVRDRR